MNEMIQTQKVLFYMRWTVLGAGMLTTVMSWMFRGEFTPLVLLPTTLGVIGFSIVYGFWAMAFKAYRDSQPKGRGSAQKDLEGIYLKSSGLRPGNLDALKMNPDLVNQLRN